MASAIDGMSISERAAATPIAQAMAANTMAAEAPPTAAGILFAPSRHCSTSITRKRDVIAKSMPSDGNLTVAPARAPAATPTTQYMWSSAVRNRQ